MIKNSESRPSPPAIRNGTVSDLSSINDIYAYYARETIATFDTAPPSLDGRAKWFDAHSTHGRHRLFVAAVDGTVVGWAASGPLRPRPAYDTSVETSIYLSSDMTGWGIGTMLYERLFAALSSEDVHRAYAVMSLPNAASITLHERFGFVRAAIFSEQGRKFGRYWDVAWYERHLS